MGTEAPHLLLENVPVRLWWAKRGQGHCRRGTGLNPRPNIPGQRPLQPPASLSPHKATTASRGYQGLSVGTPSPLLYTQVASGWDQPVGRGQRTVSGLLLWALGIPAPLALQARGAGLMTLVSGSSPSPHLASFSPQTLPSAGPPMRGLAACPASGHDCFLHGPAWCWRAVMPREA